MKCDYCLKDKECEQSPITEKHYCADCKFKALEDECNVVDGIKALRRAMRI
jgi:hypothetical protein